MRVLGLDGCRGGWAGALLTDGSVQLRRYEGWGPGLAAALEEDVDLVAIDIPIGLPAPGHRRTADEQARAMLGRRASSVFPAPPRELLGLPSHAAASAASVAAGSGGISIQGWNIYGRVAAVDALLTPALQARVVEVHPEVAFRELAGRDLGSKHQAAGQVARRDALRAALRVAPPDRLPGAAPDDVLDALACAWTARRWLAGTARLLPAQPPRDARGLFMGIAG